MLRAAGLLNLPAGNEHHRLARVANSDTQLVLSEAIERYFIEVDRATENQSDAAWISIVEATNKGEQWAVSLGNALWPRVKDPEAILQALSSLRIPLGTWIAEKIEASAAHVNPIAFVGAIEVDSTLVQPLTWVRWLMQTYDRRKPWRRLASPTMYTSVAEESEPLKHPPIAAISELPPIWQAWIAAGAYETDPSAANLANTLESIADLPPSSEWKQIEWLSSWPLAVCIRAAETPSELRRFAGPLRSGQLGDVADWRLAQRSWRRIMDISLVLASAEDELPWCLASLASVPPFLSFPAWQWIDRSKRKKQPAPREIAKQANHIFATTSSQATKQWAAETALIVIQRLTIRDGSHAANVADWVAALPDGVSHLVPRPRCLRKPDWLRLLNSASLPTRSRWYSSLDDVADAMAESNGHPIVLRVAVLLIDMHLDVDGRIRFEKLQIGKEVRKLQLAASAPATERADVHILRIAFDGPLDDSDADIIEAVAAVANEVPQIWGTFLTALRMSTVTRPRAISLLAAAYKKIGRSDVDATRVIRQLRDLLQTRTSGLDDLSMWNRLALPRPYPHPPRHARLGGGIPSRPIAIEEIELQDIRGIHRLKLSLATPSDGSGQWLVILGPNGVGKTTLLRSLAMAVRNVRDITIWPSGVFSESWRRLNRSGEELRIDSRIRVKLSDGVEHVTLIREDGPAPITQLPEQSGPTLFPIFAYGCRRGSALGGAAREVNLDVGAPEIASLFDDTAGLIHAETWLLQLEADAQKSREGRAFFNVISDALAERLDMESIEVSDRKILVQEHGKPKLPFSALSDGYLTSAGWFLDLIARWIEVARRSGEIVDANFMTRMTGLVLIDEIDLHLHPRLQLDIVSRTRRLLPRMSFIVTTHNPLTLVGAKAQDIWILSSKAGRIHAAQGIDSPILLSSGQIYRRYFGIDDIYPDRLGRALQRFGFLSGYAERSDSEEAELELLEAELTTAGIRPDWEVVPRTAATGRATRKDKMEGSAP